MRPVRVSLLFLICFASILSLPIAPTRQTQAVPQWSEIKLWASYWTAERGYTSTLEMKNNRIRDTLVARVSLYFINGEEYSLDSISIAPRQTIVLNLNEIIESLPAAQRARLPKEGTIEIEYDGPNSSALMGSVSVTNPEKGIAWSFFLYPGYRGLSNAPLQGVFWFPSRETEGIVVLHNVSESSMTIHPRVQAGELNINLAPITLGAEQLTKLDLRRALRGFARQLPRAGGIELTYEGEPDALRAHGLLFDGEGLSTQVDFNRVASAAEPQQLSYHTPRFAAGHADPVLGLPRETKFEPFLVVHNFDREQSGEILVSFQGENGPQEISIPLEIRAGETRVLELESNLKGRMPRDAHWAGMEIRYTTNNTSLAMTMVSLSEDRRHSIRSVLNWVQSTTREGWYWRVDSETNTLVGIQNSATEEANVVFSLDYYIGHSRHSYELPLKIPARTSHLVNIAEIKRSAQPDADGDVIPADVTFGGYRAVKLHPREEGPLTTEALHIDLHRGNFLTVYNTGCCEEPAWIGPSQIIAVVGQSHPVQVKSVDICSGGDLDLTNIANFTSSNTNIASVDSNGNVDL